MDKKEPFWKTWVTVMSYAALVVIAILIVAGICYLIISWLGAPGVGIIVFLFATMLITLMSRDNTPGGW